MKVFWILLKVFFSITADALQPTRNRRATDAQPTRNRRATDAQPTRNRRATDAQPTCGRRIAADAQFAVPTMNYYASAACVECFKAGYKSHILVGFQDFQCFATVTHASTHRSDRCDHSPNQPHAANARPTFRPTLRRRAADYERHNAFLVFITNALDARLTLRPTMNRPLIILYYYYGRLNNKLYRIVDI